MAFLLFERTVVDGRPVISPTGSTYSLAGYNLLYKAWLAHKSPLDRGWHTTADKLIQLHTKCAHNYTTRRLIIDFHPNSNWRIGLVELLDVYACTWSDGKGQPSWTPLMLRLRDVFYEEYYPPNKIDQARKAEILSNLPEQASDSPDFVDFLCLGGPLHSWKLEKSGMMSAAFLQGAARDYFREYF
jgi:hypothetical protein